ncbi:MAG: alpha/beta hydrolase [Clostridia bacterium]
MINILVHGLGQDEKSWNEVKSQLNNNGINVETPNLFSIVKNYQVNYENIYRTFADYCNNFKEKINLVGISLGGILAIDYAIEYSEKINSIVLIGTPYDIPKKMLKLQNFIFKFMPKKTFESMEISKKDFINLTNSMYKLDIKLKVSKIKCSTLVLCGEKDNANIKSAHYLSENIKNAKIKIIENTGHIVNEENPNELAKLLIEFWRN